MKARTQFANAVPSALWTALFVGPLYVFCAHHPGLRSLCAFGAAGIAAMLLPRALLQRLALGSRLATYRRLRVPVVIRITQDAAWLRRLSGETTSRARRDTRSLAQIERDTWMRERFHVGFFVFYILCSITALLHGQFAWCLALVVANVAYNLYPIWLQQYIRLRVSRCLHRAS